jgi:hypothetical protein
MGRRAQRRRQTTTGPASTGQGTRPPAPVPAPRSANPDASPATTRPGVSAASDEVSLARLGDLAAARRLLEGEIGVLIDALAADGTGWPAIAAVLGVSRQAARQAHQRRRTQHQDRAGSSPAAGSSAAASTR